MSPAAKLCGFLLLLAVIFIGRLRRRSAPRAGHRGLHHSGTSSPGGPGGPGGGTGTGGSGGGGTGGSMNMGGP